MISKYLFLLCFVFAFVAVFSNNKIVQHSFFGFVCIYHGVNLLMMDFESDEKFPFIFGAFSTGTIMFLIQFVFLIQIPLSDNMESILRFISNYCNAVAILFPFFSPLSEIRKTSD